MYFTRQEKNMVIWRKSGIETNGFPESARSQRLAIFLTRDFLSTEGTFPLFFRVTRLIHERHAKFVNNLS